MNKNINWAPYYYFIIILILYILFLKLLIFLTNQSIFFTYTDFGWWKDDIYLLVSCFIYEPKACGSISKYPTAYLINSYIITWLNAYTIQLDSSIKFIQTSFLLFPFFIFYIIYRFKYGVLFSLLYLTLILATPLVHFYIPSGALELQSGVILGSLIALSCYYLSLTNKKNISHGDYLKIKDVNSISFKLIPFITNFLIFSFCLYKDTNLFILLSTLTITLVILFLFKIPNNLTIITAFKLWGLGSILGLFLQVIFNYIRYKSTLPIIYLYEANLLAPDLNQSLTSLTGLLFSPNGGFIVFWGLSISVLFIVLVINKIKILSSILLFTSILILISLIGHSMWWNPFGWDSWGARLSIPYGLAFIIACLGCVSPIKVKKNVTINAIKTICYSLAIIISFFSLKYISIGYLYDPKDIFGKTLHSQSSCVTMQNMLKNKNRPKDIAGDKFWKSDYYWNCAYERYWTDPYKLIN